MENGVSFRGAGFDRDVINETQKKYPEIPEDPTLNWFIDDHILFTHFIRDLKNGSFNADMCEPFMEHVAFELGKLNLMQMYNEWMDRRRSGDTGDDLDEMGDMKIIEQQRTPKSASKEAASSATKEKGPPEFDVSANSKQKKPAKVATKGAPHTHLAQAFKHVDTNAMCKQTASWESRVRNPDRELRVRSRICITELQCELALNSYVILF